VDEGKGERGSINSSPVCNWRLLGTNGKACGERALSSGLRSSDETESESDDIPGTFENNSVEIIVVSDKLDTMTSTSGERKLGMSTAGGDSERIT